VNSECYRTRALLRSASTGGFFRLQDGSRHMIPDHWLAQASLLQGGRLLRLNYTFCIVEIAGEGLEPIFEDAAIGKIGAVQAAPSETEPEELPWVSGILVFSPSASPDSQFEAGVVDA
jgi:hypothetical protein